MITGRTFAEVYDKLLLSLLEEGKKVSPRGMLTKELMQETFCIEDPNSSLIYIPGRNFSIAHAIHESFLIFCDNNRVNVAGYFNKNIAQFSDDGNTLYGSYGHRIAKKMQGVLDKLKEDHDTRQALLTIHRVEDSIVKTKDPPCTITLQFTIRDEKLNMHVYMRSNDIVWGTPYDVFMFTTIQKVFANTLGIPIGKYYHTATSLHMYERDFEKCREYIGHCEPIEYKIESKFYNWSYCADKLVRMLTNPKMTSIADFVHSTYIAEPSAILLLELVHRKDAIGEKIRKYIDVAGYVEYFDERHKLDFSKPFTKRFLEDWWYTGASHIPKEVHDK